MKSFSVGKNNDIKTFLIIDCNLEFIIDSHKIDSNKYELILRIEEGTMRQMKIDYIEGTDDKFTNWIISQNLYDFDLILLEKYEDNVNFLISKSYYQGSINYKKHRIEFNNDKFTFDNLNLLPSFYYHIKRESIKSYEK
jgi:hypothetical protein